MVTSPRNRQANPLGPMGSSSGTGPLVSTWENQRSLLLPLPCPLCQNHCRWIQVQTVASKKSVEPGTQGTALFTPGSGTHWGLAWLWNPQASSHQMACEQRGEQLFRNCFQSGDAAHRDGSTGKVTQSFRLILHYWGLDYSAASSNSPNDLNRTECKLGNRKSSLVPQVIIRKTILLTAE